MKRFYRCCVDVDRAGQVVAASYEVHADREIETYGTVLVGPFTTRDEALEAVVAALTGRFGLQEALPF